MSAHAKTVIAALVAVVITALQAWPIIQGGGFHLITALPVACAVVGAILTHVVPNVPELPWAKAVVSGALALLTALATFVGQHPSGITAGTLLTVAAGAFLVWFVPNLPPVVSVGGSPLLSHLAAVPAPSPAPAPARSSVVSEALRLLTTDPAPAPVVVPAPPFDLSATQPIPVVRADPPAPVVSSMAVADLPNPVAPADPAAQIIAAGSPATHA